MLIQLLRAWDLTGALELNEVGFTATQPEDAVWESGLPGGLQLAAAHAQVGEGQGAGIFLDANL